MRRGLRGATLACMVTALSLLACKLGDKLGDKPQAGKNCSSDGASVCQDQANQLLCQAGMWRELPCAGPSGCVANSGMVTCDISGNYAGSLCSPTQNPTPVCGDKKSLVKCDAGKIVKTDCKGPDGCRLQNGKPSCDQSIAEIGSECSHEGAWACTVDQKSQLTCKNSQWVLNASCRGPDGCHKKGKDEKGNDRLWCDQRLAYTGDSCYTDGQRACSHDGRIMLQCKNGKFAYYWSCAGTPCTIKRDGSLDCASY